MADEPTFAQQQVTEETLSESDKIRKRIADYRAQITPNSLQVIEVMLNQQLASGLLKPGDLDALIILRDDVNKASIDYRTQLENAQRRLNELATTEAAEKAQVEEAKIRAIIDSRDAERQRRKGVEDRLAQMEAVLASHGISMDLNQDGQIGLVEGQVADELTAEEQERVDNIVSVDKDNIAEIQQAALAQPVKPKRPSRAFTLARAMNPEEPSQSEILQDELEPILHSIPDELLDADELLDGPEAEYDIGEIPIPEISEVGLDEMMAEASAIADSEFGDEVAQDEHLNNPSLIAREQEVGFDANGSPTTEDGLSISESIGHAPQSETTSTIYKDTHAWADNEDKERKSFQEWTEEQTELELEVPEDAKGTEEFLKEVEQVERSSERTELADGVYIEEREVSEPAQNFGAPTSKPIISASQLPGDIKTYAETEDYPGETKEPEEEYDEVTIPSESELKSMTKKTINAQAELVNFDVPTSLTKTKMIESFLQQTEEFIAGLQESGDFVSATMDGDEDGDDDDTNNNQDGGYF